jgi:Transposase DDE domain
LLPLTKHQGEWLIYEKDYHTHQLLQSFITEEDITRLAKQYGYEDTARKLSLMDLLKFWVISAAEKWSSFRDSETKLPNYTELPNVDHSTLAKKAKAVPYEIIRDVFQLLIERANRSFRRKFFNDYKLYAMDSTMITFKHPQLSWARYSSHRHAIRLHVKFDVDEHQPTQVIQTTGRDQDIMVAPKLLSEIPVLAIHTADRGYASTAFFEQLHQQGHYFVIRVADFFTVTRPKSLKRWASKETNIMRDETALLGKETRMTKTRFRLVTFLDDNGHEIRVATNVMNLSAEKIAEIYKLRWQIELFFRWIKSNLQIDHVYGRSQNAVYSQVFGTLIAYVLMRWLYNETKSLW